MIVQSEGVSSITCVRPRSLDILLAGFSNPPDTRDGLEPAHASYLERVGRGGEGGGFNTEYTSDSRVLQIPQVFPGDYGRPGSIGRKWGVE